MSSRLVRMRTGVLRLALLVGSVLLITSCVTLTAESEINEDLSGTHTLTVTIDRSTLESLGDEFNPDDVQEDMQPENVPEGYQAEVIDTPEEVGSRISTTVDDSGPLGDVLNDLFNAGETEGDPVNPFSGTLERDGDTYRLNVTVDGDLLAQSSEDDLGGEDSGFDMDQILDMTYTILLPGEILSTNGTELEDGRIQWELPTSGVLEMTAVSETEGDSNLWLWLLVAGVAALVLIGLAAIIVLVIVSRRKPDTAAAPVPPPAPADDDPNVTPARPMPQPAPQSDPFADTAPTPPVWMQAPPEAAAGAGTDAPAETPEAEPTGQATNEAEPPAPQRPGEPPAS